MSHLASAEADPAFTQLQVERFREATAGLGTLTRHLANSAPTLRYAEARFDAVRCGIALYGISPFGADPARRRARACAALGVVRRAREEARAGREHRLRPPVRRRPADLDRRRPGRLRGRLPSRHDGHRGSRRGRATPRRGHDLDGCARSRARCTGSRSGTPVTLLGDGILIEEHARVAGTIAYEIATGLNTRSGRARRVATDG